ncbi:DUF4160 domain-containing protein [Conexibacter stalactiti]|uniref:DUF4160 domain-containing protein n=1 Tax=Conexibacter stalactiti TaxID=1940611 RepID=UPI00384EC308
MPRISAFYGITIFMYIDEHPPPHFHAWYSGARASIDIATRDLVSGSLPPRALRIVREWARQHERELTANWRRARRDEPLTKIEPLR